MYVPCPLMSLYSSLFFVDLLLYHSLRTSVTSCHNRGQILYTPFFIAIEEEKYISDMSDFREKTKAYIIRRKEKKELIDGYL